MYKEKHTCKQLAYVYVNLYKYSVAGYQMGPSSGQEMFDCTDLEFWTTRGYTLKAKHIHW